MDEHPNARLVREFHVAQGRLYADGDPGPASALLAEDVVWHVPGRNRIAGEHRGREAVLRYFHARREAMGGTFRVHVHDVLANDERVVILAGGRAERAGRPVTWETAGIFRIAGGRIAECRLVPFDQYEFDAIWS